jgi:2-methylcitrate dehydratase PrpD
VGTSDQTEALVRFLGAQHQFPEDVLHEAKRAMLGYFAAAFSGIESPIWQSAKRAMQDVGQRGECTALGTSTRWAPQDAAFLNAIAGNVLDFDDTHLPTIIHPSSPVIPVLWALSARLKFTGRDMLSALILSFEAMCRLGNATHPDSYKRGFHVTATCGVVGAAVAAALLKKREHQELKHIIGLAANQGAGLIANLATPAKAISVGNAARNGLLAPTFVAAGITASPMALEGQFGFIQATSSTGNPQALTEQLGSDWEIRRVAQKPYPTGVVLNPVIDASLALRDALGTRVDQIKSIIVTGHPLLKDRADRPVVTSIPDARLSVQHTVAVTVLRGLPSVRSFHQEAFNDPRVQALAKRVVVQVNEQMSVESAHLSMVLNNDQALVSEVAQGRGSLSNPLSDQDLQAKLVNSALSSTPDYDPARLIEKIWMVDRLENAAELFESLPINQYES